MRSLVKDPVSFNLASEYSANYELNQRKFAHSLVIAVLYGLGISKEQVESVVNGLKSVWSDSTSKVSEDMIKAQESLNLMADLYGEFMVKGHRSKRGSQQETAQSKIARLRRGESFVRIDPSECNGCRMCLSSCPAQAIIPYKTNSIIAFKIDIIKCTLCEKCLKVQCPKQAIKKVDSNARS